MKRLTAVCLVLFVAAGSAFASINVYTAENLWQGQLYTSVNTINWDDVAVGEGTYTTIASNRYSYMPGSPTLSVDGRSRLLVGNPTNPDGGFFGADFYPVSQNNVFSPDASGSPEGRLTISFDQGVYAFGTWFLDVEGDFAVTGIKVDGVLYSFGANQSDNSKSFLGIVSSIPFLSADIYMAYGGGAENGVGIDDVKYALVPVPIAVVLGMLGLGVAGLKLRKFV